MFTALWMQGLLNFRLLSEACKYTGPDNFSKIRTEEPDFWGVLVWPLVDARWHVERRIQELMRHYRVAAKLGKLLNFRLNEIRPILKLDAVCESLEVCLERQVWFIREGQVTLSLFHAGERVYSLAFLLSCKDGMRVAYVGAIQGVKQTEDSDTYKIITKGAHGLRPRDLLITLFLQLCESMRVSQVLAVQNKYRQHQHRYFGTSGNPEVFAQYDAIWTENSGVLRSDGMYLLAPGTRKKDLAEVPSKKRSMYRKREQMLEECQIAFNTVVEASIAAEMHSGYGEPVTVSKKQYPPPVVNETQNTTWLAKARPAFLGSWLWSFPAIFM